MALSIDILRSPGCFAFAARTFTWVVVISRIPDRQAKKSRIPCPNFGESRFPGSSQISNPVKIFCVFPNPAPYFCQIPDPENTLPDPVRFILGDYSSPYSSLLTKVNSTSLADKRIQNFLTLLYKSLFFPHFPAYLKNMFSLRSSSYDL